MPQAVDIKTTLSRGAEDRRIRSKSAQCESATLGMGGKQVTLVEPNKWESAERKPFTPTEV